jgi:hypothetical protein
MPFPSGFEIKEDTIKVIFPGLNDNPPKPFLHRRNGEGGSFDI